MKTISTVISSFVKGCDLDSFGDGVLDYAKLMIADSLGVALSGSDSEVAASARRAILALAEGGGGASGATLIGAVERTNSRDAALVNGISMDVLGMDDTYLEGSNHPSAVVLPATLAVAETLGSSGRAMLGAYVAGVEVATRIASAARLGFIGKGFSTTAISGCFGAAVAAGKLLGLSEEELVEAQGFVGEIAAGSMQFLDSGTWTKNVNKGWPAACGVTAAYFATSGFKSPPDVYEGRFGIFTLHTNPTHETDISQCTDRLGEQWRIFDVCGKRYPVCHSMDAYVRAAHQLREQTEGRLANIVDVECFVPAPALPIICEPEALLRRPDSMNAASVSTYYCVALAMLGHGVTFESQEKFMHDAEVLAFSDKVRYTIPEHTLYPKIRIAKIIATMDDGSTVTVEQASGPLTEIEVHGKFFELVPPVIGLERANDAWTKLMDIENVKNVGEIGALFAL